MNEINEDKQHVYQREMRLIDVPDLALVGPVLNHADWGMRCRVSVAEVLYLDEDGPTRFVQSWAPTKVVPAKILVESDLDFILDWVSEHRGKNCQHVRETVSVAAPQVPPIGLLRLPTDTPVIQVWRVAYQWNGQPILAQMEKRRPDLHLAYDRYLPYEKTLERQRAEQEWGVGA